MVKYAIWKANSRLTCIQNSPTFFKARKYTSAFVRSTGAHNAEPANPFHVLTLIFKNNSLYYIKTNNILLVKAHIFQPNLSPQDKVTLVSVALQEMQY